MTMVTAVHTLLIAKEEEDCDEVEIIESCASSKQSSVCRQYNGINRYKLTKLEPTQSSGCHFPSKYCSTQTEGKNRIQLL